VRIERALALLIGGLAVAIVIRSTVIPSGWHFVFNVGIGAFAVAVARLAGLSADELGCARRHVRSGLRHGALALLAVTIAVSSAAPFGVLDDDRTTIGAGEMLLRVLVVIPIGTVLVEELAFRGTLHGLLDRVASPTRSLVAGSVLFGLWHIAPIVDDGVWIVAGTVLATTVAGAAFIWLRRRSGSLLAPILAHVGTNSATFALSWAVSR
jgi:membrane protease YdiL (CAAX protease family)